MVYCSFVCLSVFKVYAPKRVENAEKTRAKGRQQQLKYESSKPGQMSTENAERRKLNPSVLISSGNVA